MDVVTLLLLLQGFTAVAIAVVVAAVAVAVVVP
jgi:hypothetical protein